MDIAVRASPDVDLVVHVVEVAGRGGKIGDRTRSAAEGRGQGRCPLIAVLAVRRIAGAGLIEQREICAVQIGRARDEICG